MYLRKLPTFIAGTVFFCLLYGGWGKVTSVGSRPRYSDRVPAAGVAACNVLGSRTKTNPLSYGTFSHS